MGQTLSLPSRNFQINKEGKACKNTPTNFALLDLLEIISNLLKINIED